VKTVARFGEATLRTIPAKCGCRNTKILVASSLSTQRCGRGRLVHGAERRLRNTPVGFDGLLIMIARVRGVISPFQSPPIPADIRRRPRLESRSATGGHLSSSASIRTSSPARTGSQRPRQGPAVTPRDDDAARCRLSRPGARLLRDRDAQLLHAGGGRVMRLPGAERRRGASTTAGEARSRDPDMRVDRPDRRPRAPSRRQGGTWSGW